MVATRRGTRTSASDSQHTEPAASHDVNTQSSSASVRSTRRTTRRDKESEQQLEKALAPSTTGSKRAKRGRAQSSTVQHTDESLDATIEAPSQVSTRGSVRSRRPRTDEVEQQVSTSTRASNRKRKKQNDQEPESAPSTQPQPVRSLRRRAPPTADQVTEAAAQLQHEAEKALEIVQAEHIVSGRAKRKVKSLRAEETVTEATTRSKRGLPLPLKKSAQLQTGPQRTKDDANEVIEESTSLQEKSSHSRKQKSNKAAEPEAEAAPAKARTRAPRARQAIGTRPDSPTSDASMSSRATTPSLSPAPHFIQPKDFSEDRADSRDAAEDQDDDTLEALLDHPEEVSEDELAGPKTPMRRAAQVKMRVRRGKKANLKQGQIARVNTSASSAQLSSPPDTEDRFNAAEPASESQAAEHQHDGTDEDLLIPVPTELEEVVDDSLFAEDTLFGDIPSEPLHEPTPFEVEAVAGESLQESDNMDVDSTVLVDEDQIEPGEHQSVAPQKLPEDQPDAGTDAIPQESEPADDDADDLEYTRLTNDLKTPRPQTINWYHVEPNTVLRDTIDLGLSPNVDQSQLGILPDITASSPIKAPEQAPSIEQEDDHSEVEDETVEFTEFVSLPSAMQSTPLQQSVVQPVAVSAVGEVLPLQVEQDEVYQEQRDPEIAPADAPQSNAGDASMPHYMLPTVAFDARRKTLPARMISTPARVTDRPKTSDGSGPFGTDRPGTASSRPASRPASRFAPRQVEGLATPVRSKRVLAPFALTTPSIVNQKSPMRSTAKSNNKTAATTPRAPHTVAGYSRTMLAYSSSRQGNASVTLDKLKRLARDENNSGTYRSPARTPLRSITGVATAGAITPHPAIPLRGVLAIVEVYTCEGASASAPFVALLHRLGAKTTKIWTDRVTHVIFKDGSPTTLHKIAQHNKRALRTGEGRQVHCVNSRWVSDCDVWSTRLNETDDAYAVSTETLTGSAKRKRKSMEPTPIMNVDGNLVKDRRASWGRSSSQSRSRSITPVGLERLHGAFSSSKLADSSFEGSLGTASPSTPAWIAAPHRLIQSTAPVKRIRKLAPIAGIRFGTSRSIYEQLPRSGT